MSHIVSIKTYQFSKNILSHIFWNVEGFLLFFTVLSWFLYGVFPLGNIYKKWWKGSVSQGANDHVVLHAKQSIHISGSAPRRGDEGQVLAGSLRSNVQFRFPPPARIPVALRVRGAFDCFLCSKAANDCNEEVGGWMPVHFVLIIPPIHRLYFHLTSFILLPLLCHPPIQEESAV